MRQYIGSVTAYAYAVSKGYTGTEEEFAELMASYATIAQNVEAFAVPANVKQAMLTLFQSGAYAQTGLTDEIAIIEAWANQATQYTITNTLSHVSNSNSAATVAENSAYTGTLTSDEGYVIDSVTVTMGGVDITSQVFTPST